MTLRSLSRYVSGPSVPAILRSFCCSRQSCWVTKWHFLVHLETAELLFSLETPSPRWSTAQKGCLQTCFFRQNRSEDYNIVLTDTFRGMTAQPWLQHGQCGLLECWENLCHWYNPCGMSSRKALPHTGPASCLLKNDNFWLISWNKLQVEVITRKQLESFPA